MLVGDLRLQLSSVSVWRADVFLNGACENACLV